MNPNPLANLVTDYWYKAVLVCSVVVLLVSLTVKLQGVDNRAVQLLSLGLSFVGIGEWINHPLRTGLMYHPIHGHGVTTSHPRQPSTTGRLFDLLGFVLCVAGTARLLGL